MTSSWLPDAAAIDAVTNGNNNKRINKSIVLTTPFPWNMLMLMLFFMIAI
jgi:hypothetical protein